MKEEFEKAMLEAKAADLRASWQAHRAACLRLAIDMGNCGPVVMVIERAEKFSDYVLNGKARA